MTLQTAPTQRERQRAATRERLYQAALDEIRVHGFESASIDRIASGAGVVRGTFYFHFASKEAVLLELEQRTQGPIVEALCALESSEPGLREILTTISAGIAASPVFREEPDLLREMLAVYVRAPRTPPARDPDDPSDVDDAADLPLVAALRRLAGGAAARGLLRRDLTAEQVAGIFLASLFGVLAGPPVSGEERREAIDLLVDVMVKGLGA